MSRLAPLAGLAFGALQAAGFLTIGPDPEPDAPLSTVVSFYGTHHARVAAGGWLLAWATLFLACFGVWLWTRLPGPAGAAALVGTAVVCGANLVSATGFVTLGGLGGKASVAPGALQSWHVLDSALYLPYDGGIAILLLAVALAGAFPRALAWPAAAIAFLQLTPVGFFGSLLFLVWTAATGIALVAGPRRPGGAIAAAAVAGPGSGR